MSGVNKAIILGRLGKDPEIKTFQSGGKIAQFSVATSETWTDKNSGEKKEKTQWHNCVVKQDGLVEIVKKYVKKGDNIYLEGQIETRSWEKDGTTHYTTEIIVGFNGKINLLGDRKKDDGGSQSEEKASTKRPAHQEDPDDSIPF